MFEEFRATKVRPPKALQATTVAYNRRVVKKYLPDSVGTDGQRKRLAAEFGLAINGLKTKNGNIWGEFKRPKFLANVSCIKIIFFSFPQIYS